MQIDSSPQLASSFEEMNLSVVSPIGVMATDRVYFLAVTVSNHGKSVIRWSEEAPLTISSRWFMPGDTGHHIAEGERAVFEFLESGAAQTARLRICPPNISGPAILRVSCVCEGVCWFYEKFKGGWLDLPVALMEPTSWPDDVRGSKQSVALRGYVAAQRLRHGLECAAAASPVVPQEELPEQQPEADGSAVAADLASQTLAAVDSLPLNTAPLADIPFAAEGNAGQEQLSDLPADAMPRLRWIRHPIQSVRDFLLWILGTSSIAHDLSGIRRQNDVHSAEIQALKRDVASVRNAAVEILAGDLPQVLHNLASVVSTLGTLKEAVRRLNVPALQTRELLTAGFRAGETVNAELDRRLSEVRNNLVQLNAASDELQLNSAALESHLAELRISIRDTVQQDISVLRSEVASGVAAVSSKSDILIHRQVISAPKSGVAIARNALGLFAIPDGDLETLSYYSSGFVPESGSVSVLQRFLQAGSCFVDVGANIGLFTVAAGRIVGPSGKIISIEPAPNTMSALEATVRLNGLASFVDLHSIAAGSKFGEAALNVAKMCGHSSLYPIDSAAGSVVVRMLPLDAVIGEQAVDLIKIDIEGFELDAIEGLKNTLSGNPNTSILVEFSPIHLARSGRAIADWDSMLSTYGFTPYAIDEGSGWLREARIADFMDVFSVNLLLARGKYLELIRT